METMPKDPVMLMSFINMKMRDEYRTLEDFCMSYSLDKTRLIAEMENAGFSWLPSVRQFR